MGKPAWLGQRAQGTPPITSSASAMPPASSARSTSRAPSPPVATTPAAPQCRIQAAARPLPAVAPPCRRRVRRHGLRAPAAAPRRPLSAGASSKGGAPGAPPVGVGQLRGRRHPAAGAGGDQRRRLGAYVEEVDHQHRASLFRASPDTGQRRGQRPRRPAARGSPNRPMAAPAAPARPRRLRRPRRSGRRARCGPPAHRPRPGRPGRHGRIGAGWGYGFR